MLYCCSCSGLVLDIPSASLCGLAFDKQALQACCCFAGLSVECLPLWAGATRVLSVSSIIRHTMIEAVARCHRCDAAYGDGPAHAANAYPA